MCPKPTALETHEFLESLRLGAKKEQVALDGVDALEFEEEERQRNIALEIGENVPV
jgi:hypothetical protein